MCFELPAIVPPHTISWANNRPNLKRLQKYFQDMKKNNNVFCALRLLQCTFVRYLTKSSRSACACSPDPTWSSSASCWRRTRPERSTWVRSHFCGRGGGEEKKGIKWFRSCVPRLRYSAFLMNLWHSPHSGTPSPCRSWRISCVSCSERRRSTWSRSCNATPKPGRGCRGPCQAPRRDEEGVLSHGDPMQLVTGGDNQSFVAAKHPRGPQPTHPLCKRRMKESMEDAKERASADVRVKCCEREREKAKVPYTWSESDAPARMRDENMRNWLRGDWFLTNSLFQSWVVSDNPTYFGYVILTF